MLIGMGDADVLGIETHRRDLIAEADRARRTHGVSRRASSGAAASARHRAALVPTLVVIATIIVAGVLAPLLGVV